LYQCSFEGRKEKEKKFEGNYVYYKESTECQKVAKHLTISVKRLINPHNEELHHYSVSEYQTCDEINSKTYEHLISTDDWLEDDELVEEIYQSEELKDHNEIYEVLSGDKGTVEFTEEGTKAFFEMLEKPNPIRDRVIEESQGLLNEEQLAKFGKETISVKFSIAKKE
jgi:hypothetical protein